MPCRVDLFHCKQCGGEHYFHEECLTDPSKYREGLVGYNKKPTQASPVKKANKDRFNAEGALCDVLSLLEDNGMLKDANIPKDILDWWKKHQSSEKNKIKKAALKKLSAKEKRALGLK
jgi:hypothetical protein